MAKTEYEKSLMHQSVTGVTFNPAVLNSLPYQVWLNRAQVLVNTLPDKSETSIQTLVSKHILQARRYMANLSGIISSDYLHVLTAYRCGQWDKDVPKYEIDVLCALCYIIGAQWLKNSINVLMANAINKKTTTVKFKFEVVDNVMTGGGGALPTMELMSYLVRPPEPKGIQYAYYVIDAWDDVYKHILTEIYGKSLYHYEEYQKKGYFKFLPTISEHLESRELPYIFNGAFGKVTPWAVRFLTDYQNGVFRGQSVGRKPTLINPFTEKVYPKILEDLDAKMTMLTKAINENNLIPYYNIYYRSPYYFAIAVDIKHRKALTPTLKALNAHLMHDLTESILASGAAL